jgi:hypothetical protein
MLFSGRVCHSEVPSKEHPGRERVLQLVRWLRNGISWTRYRRLQHHLPQHLHCEFQPDGT